MPPKFMLAALKLQDKESTNGSFLESLRMNEHGVTVMTSSFNPFIFNTEGMQGAGQHYKISQEDVHIIERVGSGASSIVYKAILKRERRFVAVKKINVFERDTRRQMIADISALSKLSEHAASSHLVAFTGAYHAPDTGQISIVLQYMDGGSLEDLIAKAGAVPEEILSQITAQVLQGLMFLHKKALMVHRDMKPANILLSMDGDVKISDFGISTFIASTLAKCTTFLGTIPYMSPERLENSPYSFPSDIWALGISLVEAATGQYPYNNHSQLDLMIQVMKEEVPLLDEGNFSPEFKSFIQVCLRKEASHRATAEQLLCHPFINKHQGASSLKGFVQRMHNYDELLQQSPDSHATH